MLRPTRKTWYRFLRISVRGLFLLVTLCCVAVAWWQQPYTVETLQRVVQRNSDQVIAEGRRVETFRRRLLEDPVKHGPTTIYDEQGDVVFQGHWFEGRRHGPYRHWLQPSGRLAVELVYEHGKLVRYRGKAIDDFVAGRADLRWGLVLRDPETQLPFR